MKRILTLIRILANQVQLAKEIFGQTVYLSLTELLLDTFKIHIISKF